MTAERLLSQCWDLPVRIGDVETLREGKCFRVGLFQAPFESAIVKIERSEGMDADWFFDEWASLAFLNESASGQGLVPRLFCGDHAERMVLFEDFGKGESVASALMGDDREGKEV
jgi:hypothetical protein